MGLRTAWSMSSSVMSCFRAVCAIRTERQDTLSGNACQGTLSDDRIGPGSDDRKSTAAGARTALESQLEPCSPIRSYSEHSREHAGTRVNAEACRRLLSAVPGTRDRKGTAAEAPAVPLAAIVRARPSPSDGRAAVLSSIHAEE